jgi:hypothetical protein
LTFTLAYTYTQGDLPLTVTYPGGPAGQAGEPVTFDYWRPAGLPKGMSGEISSSTYWYVPNSPGTAYNPAGRSSA